MFNKMDSGYVNILKVMLDASIRLMPVGFFLYIFLCQNSILLVSYFRRVHSLHHRLCAIRGFVIYFFVFSFQGICINLVRFLLGL